MRRLMVVVLVLAFAPAVFASETKVREARRVFKEGLRYYEHYRFADALDSFKKAYAIKPSYRILYNIGQVQVELDHPDLALEAFEGYLAEGGKKIPKRRRAQVSVEIERLRLEVGEVSVDGPGGNELWVDGERKGHLPLAAPLRLPAGEHLLVIRKNGASCEVNVTVLGGRRKKVGCEPVLPPQPKEEETVVDTSSPMPLVKTDDERVFLNKVAPWLATGLTIAAATAGTVCAWKTSEINGKLNGACENGQCPPEYQDDVDRLPRYAGAADGLFVATAVLGAAAVTLFVAPWRDREEE